MSERSVRRFSDNPKAEFRALQIWQILICVAVNRQTITYKRLADDIWHGKGAGVLANSLGHVAFYCIQNKLPPLTALVVNAKTGLPGDGIPVEESLSKREKVFAFDWFDVIPPIPEDLGAAAKEGRE